MNNYRKVEGKDQIIMEKQSDNEIRYLHLLPNVYRLWDAGGLFTGPIPMFEGIPTKDKLVQFKTGIVAKVVEATDKFLKDETKRAYSELKIAHKMGMLFYGKPGTGKTSTCLLIMKDLVEKHGAVCLDCTGKTLSFIKYCIGKLREIQDNPIVVFVDEFESVMRREETDYLTFLDGGDSIDNFIFIACTNYIDRIPNRIKKRKSRIKYLHNINSLPIEIYREYLADRVPAMPEETLGKFAYYAEEAGLTIDQLKHALIDYKIDSVPIEEAVKIAAKFDIEESDEEES